MKLRLRIKKRSHNEVLVLFIFFMPFLGGFLNEFLGLPSVTKYTIDCVCIFLLMTMIFRAKTIANMGTQTLLKWIVFFLIYSLILYIANYQSVLYYLWGLRNNFRFYVFFFACIAFLKSKDTENFLKWLDRIFYINTIVVLFQYFILGLNQDNLGGLFGVRPGCNGYMNIFLVIVITKCLVYYMNKQETTGFCCIKCALALFVAALAELKYFFVEFAIIVLLIVVLTRFSKRKLYVVIAACIGIYVGITLLVYIFPEFKEVMSLQGLYETAISDKGYTSSGDMNRLTVFSMSSKMFLRTKLEQLFGLGLGNCDYSDAFAILTTPFYRKYYFVHYTWFLTACIFLEMGLVGIIFYFGFFILIYFEIHKREIRKQVNPVYSQMAKILSILCIAICIYDSSLRTEAAYMMYFFLAIPFLKDGLKNTGLER